MNKRLSLGFLVEGLETDTISTVPINSTSETLKKLARENASVLKAIIQLYGYYRGDDKQLSSKDAKGLMTNIMRVMAGNTVSATALGNVSWEPDSFAFTTFFDQVGDQPLGKFLGIIDVAAIPDVGLELQADQIRDAATEKKEKEKEAREAIKLTNSKIIRRARGASLYEVFLK